MDKSKPMRQLTVVTKDKIGLLASVSGLLGKNKININSISAEKVEEEAVIRLVVEDYDKAKGILEKAGYKIAEDDVIITTIKDRPGELSKLAQKMADAKINIENLFMVGKKGGEAVLAIKVDNIEEARKLL